MQFSELANSKDNNPLAWSSLRNEWQRIYRDRTGGILTLRSEIWIFDNRKGRFTMYARTMDGIAACRWTSILATTVLTTLAACGGAPQHPPFTENPAAVRARSDAAHDDLERSEERSPTSTPEHATPTGSTEGAFSSHVARLERSSNPIERLSAQLIRPLVAVDAQRAAECRKDAPTLAVSTLAERFDIAEAVAGSIEGVFINHHAFRVIPLHDEGERAALLARITLSDAYRDTTRPVPGNYDSPVAVIHVTSERYGAYTTLRARLICIETEHPIAVADASFGDDFAPTDEHWRRRAPPTAAPPPDRPVFPRDCDDISISEALRFWVHYVDPETTDHARVVAIMHAALADAGPNAVQCFRRECGISASTTSLDHPMVQKCLTRFAHDIIRER